VGIGGVVGQGGVFCCELPVSEGYCSGRCRRVVPEEVPERFPPCYEKNNWLTEFANFVV